MILCGDGLFRLLQNDAASTPVLISESADSDIILQHFLEMEPQDRIAFVVIEFMRFSVLGISVEFGGIAAVSDGPVLDVRKEIFSHALGAYVRIDDDVVDFQLFPRIEAHRYPAIGHSN